MPLLRVLAVAAMAWLCACGDNLLSDGRELGPSRELVIVAHQDDDLLFMQPDLLEAVQRDGGITTVYVTAGNGTRGVGVAEERYEGLREAYAEAAGARDWHCGWIEVLGHVAQHCRLESRPVSLVFLGYPDGGKEGEYDASLLRLWQGAITSAETIGERTTRYSREELIDVVAHIARHTQPATVRTLEIAATHGRDHADHMIVGALSMLAMARANIRADLLSYRGYDIANEPPNKLPAVYDAAFAVLARYEACATDCGTCGETCTTIKPSHTTWLARRYAIGFRPTARGRLRGGTRCLTADLAFADCNAAPSWELDDAGQLRSEDGRCLAVDASGDAALTACLGGPERTFFFDDEGHVWSGVPPTPAPDMGYAHLWCLAHGDEGLRVQLCGEGRAPTWEIMPRTAATPRSELGLSATGREVRLGDVDGDGHADLCAIEDGLVCALGDGAGAFATPAVRFDSVVAPLAIDPRSLAFGDVDGDQRTDACGRDSEGILCATAASGFAAARWSSSFNDRVARAGTSPSLAAIDANADGTADVCGVEENGLVCALPGLALQPTVRSRWPDANAVVWPVDLDGDRQADWCTATETGPACAVEAQRELTTDGAPWGYSFAGNVDIAPATTATVALADIDGDGRADLCRTREDRIVCARSQGRAFGPSTATLAILPNQSAASALWLGDLDGDGRADPCVDAGATIVCAVEP